MPIWNEKVQTAIILGFVGGMISANTKSRSGINVARASEQRITSASVFKIKCNISWIL